MAYIDMEEFEYVILNEGIEVAKHKCKDYESYINGANQFRYQMKNAIRKQPTADVVEVKRGKWQPTKIPSYFGGIIYECSLCGAKDGDHSQILGKYCWRCGAIMNRTPKERGGEK